MELYEFCAYCRGSLSPKPGKIFCSDLCRKKSKRAQEKLERNLRFLRFWDESARRAGIL